MNNISKKVTTIFITLLCNQSIAQTNFEKNSVWAWEINSINRKVLILGELHQFVFEKNSEIRISHELGRKIYDISAEVWVETRQALPVEASNLQKLSNQLKPETWEKVKSGFKRATESMKHWEIQARNNLLNLYIENLDRQDPFNAYANLFRFADAGIRINKINYKVVQGLNSTLTNHEKTIITNSKLISLEGPQAIAEAWWNNCNNKEKAETLIVEALKWQNHDYDFSKDSEHIVQSIFLQDGGNADAFESDLVNNTHSDIIISECISVPRTKNWMPKILESLSTKGPPVTYLVGIGHVGGKEGILSLLRQKGYSDMKRIYNIK